MPDEPQRDAHPLYDKPKPTPTDQSGEQRIRQILVYDGGVRRPYVTYVLLAINIALFALRYFVPDLHVMVTLFGLADSELILNGEVYRLLTAMFLHLDETHILFNGLSLYYIGSALEPVYGHLRFAILYFLSGIAGFVLTTVLGTGGIGASGAIFGIFGAFTLQFWLHRDIYGEAGRRQLRNAIFIIGLNFAIGIIGNAVADIAGSSVRISNIGHLGGLIGGVVLAWLIGPRLQIAHEVTGYIRNAEHEQGQPIPARQLTLKNSQPLSWAWIGVYTLGLAGVLLLGVFFT